MIGTAWVCTVTTTTRGGGGVGGGARWWQPVRSTATVATSGPPAWRRRPRYRQAPRQAVTAGIAASPWKMIFSDYGANGLPGTASTIHSGLDCVAVECWPVRRRCDESAKRG